MNRSALSAAFPCTVPVLMGYLSIGIAFGLMLQAVGYGPLWAVFMSLIIYAGSGQYLGCTLLAQGTALPQVALLTFLLNFRHLFYGLSLLDTFQGTGAKKPYLIFSLTDETYALMTSVHPPAGVNPDRFYLAVAMLDHSYWILGSFIGATLGALITFDTTGIDFAMTALFVVIAVEQWKSVKQKDLTHHLPALLGFGCTILSCLIFGPDNLLIPALLAISALLLFLRGRLEQPGEEVAV
ncbi:MAG: branched-chain amino acid ABC transporter permease [Oscillospiraceae bacterium]|nr:branched-chain amino acid ABC transporter permease [Oscillospiraceae bacterium]